MSINTRKDMSFIHRCISLTTTMLILAAYGLNNTYAQSNAKQHSHPVTSNVIVAQPTLLIDSFKAGPYATLPVATGGHNTQTGDGKELIGGSRATFLSIVNPDKQPVSFQVLTSKPALIFSAGYNVSPRLELTYKIPPVSADISKYDRFLIDFDGLDHGMDLLITVFGVDAKVDGHTGEGCRVLPPDGPFTLSFPLSRFKAPAVLKTTSGISFIFQHTGWGLDYAITRISAVKGAPVGRHIVNCS